MKSITPAVQCSRAAKRTRLPSVERQASLFWSVTVYDAETRSQINTDQDQVALLEVNNKGGSETADLYFGTQAPAGREGQWIKAIRDKGWFVYFRIYGPEQPAFDGTWRRGDFEQVKSGRREAGGRRGEAQ
jgi:hypothetical protein